MAIRVLQPEPLKIGGKKTYLWNCSGTVQCLRPMSLVWSKDTKGCSPGEEKGWDCGHCIPVQGSWITWEG